MGPSSYVLAGFDGLTSIIDRFFTKSEEFDNHFTREQISNFFGTTCNKFLHSYGQNFKGKKKYGNYNEKEADLLTKCRETGFYNDSEFIVDSGAFQISVGILNREQSHTLFDIYYDFVKDYNQTFDKAFILDLPPGPGCEMFSSFKEVRDLNLLSFQRAAALPQEIRDKIIYIHHFRTPEIWKICTDILDTDDMFDKFKHHATGGIAANMVGDMIVPCIIYVLPLVPLLNRAIKYKRDYLNFHILGGSNYRDILFYELFKKLVYDKHKIKLTITYDSSTIFKGLMVGRFIPILDNGIIRKTNLRSHTLDHRFFDSNESSLEVFKKTINDFVKSKGFKEIANDHIYNDKTGTFYDEIRIYSMLYLLYMYKYIENYMKTIADEAYPYYTSGNIENFNRIIERETRKLNGNKITKKQTIKSYSVCKSLDMLSSLDEDYCKYIVDKLLVKDEFTELSDIKLLQF